MNQPEPLPTLWNSDLDEETLQQYFTDLINHAQIIAITEKHSTTDYAGPDSLDLAHAQLRLMNGQVQRLQIRYHYDDRQWCDTLILQADRIKLVRIHQQQTPCSAALMNQSHIPEPPAKAFHVSV